jgi:phage tail sheath protein FI
MAFRLSPGVSITEVDLTSVIPAVATTPAGFAGTFKQGPIDEIVTITSEDELKAIFGRPDKTNTVQNRAFHSAANFLGYGNNLKVVRVADVARARNAFAGVNGLTNAASATASNLIIKNDADYEGRAESHFDQVFTSGGVNVDAHFISRYAGAVGNELQISLLTPGTYAGSGLSGEFISAPAQSDAVKNSGGGTGNDEIHVVVKDKNGNISGKAGTILEKFGFLSIASNAKNSDGSSIYWKDVLKRDSKYILGGSNFPTAGSDTSDTNITTTSTYGLSFGGGFTNADSLVLTGGVDSLTAGAGDYFTVNSRGYGLFAGEGDDVAIVIAGEPGKDEADCKTVIGNLVDQADADKDFMVFFSPYSNDVIGPTAGTAKDNVIAFKNSVNKNSSYASMDSGYKKMFDKYNDQFVNVPLNADVAGCVARTEDVADAWYSPAGFNRGQIRGSISLPFNPSETLRDELYRNGINPVVSFPGEGTVLFGDKTLLTRPSAFDRINVRRLFIVLEKAISTAAKFSLFEFNDSFTRSQFRNLVEPFLRDVKGRRGITDFKVVCDDSNNPASVVDRNEFVADIFIKPNRSINFITLSFIATGSGVAFEEVQDAFA